MGKDSFSFNVQRKKTPFQVSSVSAGAAAPLLPPPAAARADTRGTPLSLEQRHKEVEEDKKRVRCRSLASLFTRPWRGTSLHFRIFLPTWLCQLHVPRCAGLCCLFPLPKWSVCFATQHGALCSPRADSA